MLFFFLDYAFLLTLLVILILFYKYQHLHILASLSYIYFSSLKNIVSVWNSSNMTPIIICTGIFLCIYELLKRKNNETESEQYRYLFNGILWVYKYE